MYFAQFCDFDCESQLNLISLFRSILTTLRKMDCLPSEVTNMQATIVQVTNTCTTNYRMT